MKYHRIVNEIKIKLINEVKREGEKRDNKKEWNIKARNYRKKLKEETAKKKTYRSFP